MDLLLQIGIIVFSFVGIWVGSGLAISAVEKLSSHFRISQFALSFFVLGFVTSLSEITVALSSYVEGQIQISVGNLLGATIILFIFVIPLLGLIGNGVILNHDLNKRNLLFCIVVFITPTIVIIDKNLSIWDGFVLVLLYFVLAYSMYLEDSKEERKTVKSKLLTTREKVTFSLKLIFGSVLLIWGCDVLVSQTVSFGELLHVSPFYISLIALSIGTNLPEIIVVIRSVLRNEKDIAFGNYVGSAAFNTLILGVIAITNGSTNIEADFLKVFIFTFIGLGLFYFFSKSKNEISRLESSILITLYVGFLASEILFI